MHGLLNRAPKIPICAHKNNDSDQLLVFVFQETGIEVPRLPVMSCAKMSGISRHSVGFAVLLLPVILCNQHTAICRATAFKWVGDQLIKLYALGELDSMTFYHYLIEILREADSQGSLRGRFFRPLVSSVGVQSEMIIDVISLREQRETHFYSWLKCHHNATIEFRVFA